MYGVEQVLLLFLSSVHSVGGVDVAVGVQHGLWDVLGTGRCALWTLVGGDIGVDISEGYIGVDSEHQRWVT